MPSLVALVTGPPPCVSDIIKRKCAQAKQAVIRGVWEQLDFQSAPPGGAEGIGEGTRATGKGWAMEDGCRGQNLKLL